MPEELQARPEQDTLERSAWFTFDTGIDAKSIIFGKSEIDRP